MDSQAEIGGQWQSGYINIHIDSIIRGAHLIGVYGEQFLPHDFSYVDSLRAFQAYYINKFIDYHANEISF